MRGVLCQRRCVYVRLDVRICACSEVHPNVQKEGGRKKERCAKCCKGLPVCVHKGREKMRGVFAAVYACVYIRLDVRICACSEVHPYVQKEGGRNKERYVTPAKNCLCVQKGGEEERIERTRGERELCVCACTFGCAHLRVF